MKCVFSDNFKYIYSFVNSFESYRQILNIANSFLKV